MEELIKTLSPLGVGGVLAGLMFWFYRQDRLQCSKREERMMTVIEANARASERLAANIEHLAHALERSGTQ